MPVQRCCGHLILHGAAAAAASPELGAECQRGEEECVAGARKRRCTLAAPAWPDASSSGMQMSAALFALSISPKLVPRPEVLDLAGVAPPFSRFTTLSVPIQRRSVSSRTVVASHYFTQWPSWGAWGAGTEPQCLVVLLGSPRPPHCVGLRHKGASCPALSHHPVCAAHLVCGPGNFCSLDVFPGMRSSRGHARH